MSKRKKMLFHVPCPTDGTAFVRAHPYKRLDLELVPCLVPDKKITWAELYDVDYCFFQRPAHPIEVRAIEACKAFNKPVIVDYDDYSLDITNDTNPMYEHYKKDSIQEATKACLKLANVVTVSTVGLRNSLLKHAPEANIVVIPNAVDDELFDFDAPRLEPTNTILLRGGSSHKYDWEAYKDSIIELMKSLPEYKLAVMGYHPEWLREIPANQIEYYEFTEIPTYFKTLMQIRPKLAIVPLIDDEFNRAKSAISVFEAVMAGAAVVGPDLPEFTKYGAIDATPEELVGTCQIALRDVENKYLHKFQKAQVPKLSEINELRKDILESLTPVKYKPNVAPLRTATPEEFHSYELSRGHNQEDEEYLTGHTKFVDWVLKEINPKTALEYGSGTGGTLMLLNRAGIMARGLEINPISIEYFREAHPMFEHQIIQADITKEPIEFDVPCDLGISIEVFEHINLPEEEWDKLLTQMSKTCKKFYFSSTPFHTTREFDHYWSHINIRRTSDWIKLFERNGWRFLSNPRVLTGWDCMFHSTNIA